MLQQLRILGFQGFNEQQTVDFGNLTLLYGPNSSGKSSVLRLLEILKANPLHNSLDRKWSFEADGEILGSFQDLVTGHAVDRDIEIGVRIALDIPDPSDVRARNLWHKQNRESFSVREVSANHYESYQKFDLGRMPTIRTAELCIELDFSISRSSHLTELIVRIPRFSFPAELENTSKSSGFVMTKDPNLIAFSLRAGSSDYENEDWEVTHFDGSRFGNLQDIIFVNECLSGHLGGRKSRSSTALSIEDLSSSDLAGAAEDGIAFEPLRSWFIDSQRQPSAISAPILGELTDLLSNVLEVYDRQFQSSMHVGPLRDIPSLIQESENRFLEDAVETTLGINILDTQKARKWFKELTEDQYDFRIEQLSTPNRLLDKYALSVVKNEVQMSFRNVGVGLSQVLPILLAIFPIRNGQFAKIVSIEQPELHLHPRMQSALADAFLDSISGAGGLATIGTQIIAETHSENLALRIGRRIRETCIQSVDPLYSALPEQISVVYFEVDSEGTKVKKLRYADDGEFIEPWPVSFAELRIDDFLS